MSKCLASLWLAAAVAVIPVGAHGVEAPPDLAGNGAPATPPPSAAERIVEVIEPPALLEVVGEVLAANPEIAAAAARARAAIQRAPQTASLPDPTAMVTAFLSAPETRVGPQRFSISWSQALPWLSKLKTREQMALWEAAALQAEVEAVRLAKVTETRRLFFEIAFLDELAAIQHEKREHLRQHEDAARARYATGVGEGQGVIKLQAEITRSDAVLLELATRRARLVAALEALRGRPEGTAPLPTLSLPETSSLMILPDELLSSSALLPTAEARRPEVAAAEARQASAELRRELAVREYRPDFTVGLTYTVVDPRSDLPGRLNPPNRNGEDVLGIQGGVRIPLWRQRLAAGVEEAAELETAAAEGRRQVVLGLARQLDEVTSILPLHQRRIDLLEQVLVLQAEEALRSVEAGYIAGRSSALDLLDAEHILFDSYAAAVRARTDYIVAVVELEGAVAAPLISLIPPFRPTSDLGADPSLQETSESGILIEPKGRLLPTDDSGSKRSHP